MANDNMNFGVNLLPTASDTYNLGTSTKKWIINGVSSPSLTDTTYTFSGGTNKFTVTPLGGTAQDVTVTPSIANNITGSGTSGYLAKFNGTNTVTSGPQLGSSTTTFLRNDGTWADPIGLGTENQVLTSNGTTTYWGDNIPRAIDTGIEITSQPVDIYAAVGETARFDIDYVADSDVTVVWTYKRTTDTNWQVWQGSDPKYRSMKMAAQYDGMQTKCTISNGTYSIDSNIVYPRIPT